MGCRMETCGRVAIQASAECFRPAELTHRETNTHTHTHARTATHTPPPRTPAHTHTHTHTHTHPHTHTHTHTDTHTDHILMHSAFPRPGENCENLLFKHIPRTLRAPQSTR